MLREWHYKDYYHADASVEEMEHIESHIGTSPFLFCATNLVFLVFCLATLE